MVTHRLAGIGLLASKIARSIAS